MELALNNSNTYRDLLQKEGISNWAQLKKHIQSLPYGRNSERDNFTLVLTEKKGTCSSKHALLKEIADANNFTDIHLVLGLFKMNGINNPKIASTLSKNNLDYIPEAHCYLLEQGIKKDLTSQNSDFNKIESDILLEELIQPHEVVSYKVEWHKNLLNIWLQRQNSNLSFDALWKIREDCIHALSNN